jgi:hypothetical protein
MATGQFGEENFNPGYKNFSWKQRARYVRPSFTLDIECPWGTNDGGSIDVPSATDGVVTAGDYEDIVKDLTPALKERSWVAPRAKYWSKAICERHEKYRSKDDSKWSEGPGKTVVKDYLKGQTIPGNDIEAELTVVMDDAMTEMSNANWDFYTGGVASYSSFAGEERAFGDGKKPYERLAKKVEKQGRKLAKEAGGEG